MGLGLERQKVPKKTFQVRGVLLQKNDYVHIEDGMTHMFNRGSVNKIPK